MNRILIFDTTLRDGEQAPGASMNCQEKLEIARALRDLKVDIIEAGFPAASPGDFEAVQLIARQIEGPIICGLARCISSDVERAWHAVRDASQPRLHVFLATSPVHRQHKLRMQTADVIRVGVEGVKQARELTEDVEFSAEDASRTEPDFLAEVVERVIDAGATTVNIPDTVGFAVPDQFAALIRHLRKTVRNIDNIVLSVHCHDDLGLAVANSLAAIQEGAQQVECTINGIGERAGNCALEEIVMALKTRHDRFGAQTAVETKQLCPISRMVAKFTGFSVQRNKAIVGQNAFAHEAGIHQHGMLMHRSTYEILHPEDVGFTSPQLVLGKHSGRHALQARLQELGYDLDPDYIERIFGEFKVLADKKKDIFDADLAALVDRVGAETIGPWKIVALQVNCGTQAMPTASVLLRHANGKQVREAACGDGPIDASFKAIERAIGMPLRLCHFHVQSVSVGEDAQGEVQVEFEHEGSRHRGRGVGTDIIEASACALLNGVNRMVRQMVPAEATLPVSIGGEE